MMDEKGKLIGELKPGETPPPGVRKIMVYGGKEAPRKGRDGKRVESGPGITIRRITRKVGRNEPCPCGSGKKFKRCHDAGTGWSLAAPETMTPEQLAQFKAGEKIRYAPPTLEPANGFDATQAGGQ